mgnify:CR=1 FL=1
MIEVELRAWITVPGLPFETEDRWLPFIRHLEQRHAEELGPVLTWDGDAAVVIISGDVDDAAELVDRGVRAVTNALHALGLGDCHPTSIDVEPADDPVTDAAHAPVA